MPWSLFMKIIQKSLQFLTYKLVMLWEFYNISFLSINVLNSCNFLIHSKHSGPSFLYAFLGMITHQLLNVDEQEKGPKYYWTGFEKNALKISCLCIMIIDKRNHNPNHDWLIFSIQMGGWMDMFGVNYSKMADSLF